MAAADARPVDRGQTRVPPARPRLFLVWAWMLSALLGVLFTSVTALTLTLWATDPGYAETNPPALAYAAALLGAARGAGLSCFLGQCAGGDRLAEAGALAIAVVAVAWGLAVIVVARRRPSEATIRRAIS
jgi:hypothetical protein